MSFQGFSNVDLSSIAIDDGPIRETLQMGRHEVTITEATIDDGKEGKKDLVLSYNNDKGSIRQWLTIYDPKTVKNDAGVDQQPEYVNINWIQIKKLLKFTGYEADETPDPAYFVGKKVGINIKQTEYMGKKQLRVNYHWMPDAAASDGPNDNIPF
tara:strand:+ start:156 stop:620 length:465 start_codon:yes stop_codon:yes gene_type:complete